MSEESNIQRAWKQLVSAHSAASAQRYFVDYCQTVIDARDVNVISSEAAAMYIARAMFLRRVGRDPDMEAITQYAGELEVPMPPVDQSDRWTKIDQLLADIRARS